MHNVTYKFQKPQKPAHRFLQDNTGSPEHSLQKPFINSEVFAPDNKVDGKHTTSLFAHQTVYEQQTIIPIYDSIYFWQWDTLANGWLTQPYSKIINIIYDANNNMTSFLSQGWNGSAWVNYYQYTFTYDANNNQTSELSQEWNGSAWVNYWQYTYTYDANNNRTSELYQNWNGSAWVNYWQYTYTYDANNNRTSELEQHWNGSAWVNYWQYTYTYDANNNMTSELDQTWNGSAWVNSYQEIYTYDANNNNTYTLEQQWNGNAWVNYSQETYTYDANNNMTSELEQEWDGSTWENSWQGTYTYDANNIGTSEAYKDWNSTGTAITWGDSTYYYFHTVEGINDLLTQQEKSIIEPNPFSTQATIQIYNSSHRNNLQFTLYDVLGREVLQLSIVNNQTTIQRGNLKNGIYFYKLSSNQQPIDNGKVVIQ